MLLGCCHCDEPSESASSTPSASDWSASESGPAMSDYGSSESQADASSGDQSIPPGPCVVCSASNGYAPASLKIEWCLQENDYSGLWAPYTEFGNCHADYAGPFTIHFNNAGCVLIAMAGLSQQIFQETTSCCYSSNEHALHSYNCGNDTNAKRAFAWFLQNQNGSYSVAVLIVWHNTLDPANDPQTYPEWIHNGGLWYHGLVGHDPLNCFGSWELDFLAPFGVFAPGTTTMPGPGNNVYHNNQNDPIINSFPPKVWVSLNGGILPGDACDYGEE